MTQRPDRRLFGIRLVHTVVWAFFAGCIVLIPVFAWIGELRVAVVLCAIVFVEVLILAVNSWHCPLTPMAAQYTDDRRPNFDIFLPETLARYNKEIFGTLYGVGVILVLYRWLGR